MEKTEPFYTVGGNVNWCSHCRKQYGGLWKTKNRSTIWPSNPNPKHIPKENHNSKRHMQPALTAAGLTVVRTWTQPEQHEHLFINGGMDEKDMVHV